MRAPALMDLMLAGILMVAIQVVMRHIAPPFGTLPADKRGLKWHTTSVCVCNMPRQPVAVGLQSGSY